MLLSEDDRLKRPIFFVGVPRSGTTVLFEAFSQHEQLGTLLNYHMGALGWPQVGLFRILMDNRFFSLLGIKPQAGSNPMRFNRLLPKSTEGYAFWDRYSGVNFGRSFLRGELATPEQRGQLRRAVWDALRWQGRSRWASKLTGPSRIEFLRSVFEDALFVHVVRDPRAVVESLMRVGFWREQGGLERPWWEGGVAPEQLQRWQSGGRDPAVLAALQWKAIVHEAREQEQRLPPGDYIELRYEDFMQDPEGSLSRIYAACGLPDSKRARARLDPTGRLRNMNDKYLQAFSPETVQRIVEATQPEFGQLGYEE